MELRSYQKDQLEYLEDTAGFIRGVQSPTGSGKSLVIMEYVRKHAKDYNTIVITTGFNSLVFQLATLAKSEGLKPQVLIGKSHLDASAPGLSYSENALDTQDPEKLNEKMKELDTFMAKGKKLVITNHSFFLVYKNKLKPDLLIVDEAHTFPEFFQEYNTHTIDGEHYLKLKNYANMNTPLARAFGMTMNGPVDDRLLKQAYNEMVKYTGSSLDWYAFYNALRTYRSGALIDTGDELRAVVFNNALNLDANAEVALFSATLDDYTLNMFKCRKSRVYRQNLPENRYAESVYLSVHKNYRAKLLDIWKKYLDGKKGLILCTTMDNVYFTKIALPRHYSDFDDFKKSERGLFIGSKKYFQGVDVPGLDFVALDKLPFELYDTEFKGYCQFLRNTVNADSWNDYTLPLMKNALVQAMGRLWRKNDLDAGEFDNGTVALFDERLSGKFSWVDDFVLNAYKNINIIKEE